MINRLTIRPTSKCNLNCVYCGFIKSNSTVQESDFNYITEYINSNKINEIILTGGEPFLHPIFLEHIIKNTTSTIKVITNGTIISNYLIEILKTNRLELTLSLDGDIYVHNKNRCNSLAFILNNLDDILPYIKNVNTVITSDTIFELHNTINYIKTLLPYTKLNLLFDYNTDWTTIDFSIFKYYYTTKLNYTFFESFIEQYENGICSTCGESDLFVNEDLDIFPCSNFSEEGNKIGNIKTGIDINKQRPYKVYNRLVDKKRFSCPLQNKQNTGSIFTEEFKDYSFFDSLYALVKGGLNE